MTERRQRLETDFDFAGTGFKAGEVVVVTGGGSGIGRSAALMAANSGLAVAIWDLDAANAEAVAGEILSAGGRAIGLKADVGSDRDVAEAWEATAALGPVQYLVNNAGPASSSTAPFDDNVALALGSMHRVTTSWIEAQAVHASSVVNIASVAGNYMGMGTSAVPFYPAAKGGVTGYTRWLATHYNGAPRANTIAPGFVVTPRTQPFLNRPEVMNGVARIPMGRAGRADEIASAILFLLSPAASYVNGVLLPVDGGWVLS